MNKLITSMLILSLFLFNSCNHSETSTEIQSNTPPKPTDFTETEFNNSISPLNGANFLFLEEDERN